MENLKMYIRKDDLSDYEKENNKISFRRLIEKLFTDMVLCNDITKLFYQDINGVYSEPQLEIGSDYDDESGDYIDSVSELVALCERDGFIPRYYTDGPQDKVDRTIQDLQGYTRSLIMEEQNLGEMIEMAVRQIQ